MKGLVAIVDGYRLGNLFAPRLVKRGYQCVHIQSDSLLHKNFINSFKSDDYIAHFVFDNNIDYIINSLKKLNVKFVIPGHEKGVMLADKMSERMGVNTNGTQLSSARRNKYKMLDALRASEVETSQYFMANNRGEAINYAKIIGKWPVIIKPIASAGGEGVAFCYSLEEVASAFDKVLNVENFLGLKNESALVQSLIKGKDYMVNTVSVNGKHFLSDIWFSKKDIIGQHIVFDYDKLLSYEAAETPALLDYIFRSLDALGIKHGAAHNEVTLTKDGPILIETGARVMGSIHPDWISESIGRNQMDLTIDSYIQPEKFNCYSSSYKVKKHIINKFIIPYVSGTIKTIQHLDYIKKLRSFYAFNLHKQIGSRIDLSYDSFRAGTWTI